jgi:hypothetical protein
MWDMTNNYSEIKNDSSIIDNAVKKIYALLGKLQNPMSLTKGDIDAIRMQIGFLANALGLTDLVYQMEIIAREAINKIDREKEEYAHKAQPYNVVADKTAFNLPSFSGLYKTLVGLFDAVSAGVELTKKTIDTSIEVAKQIAASKDFQDGFANLRNILRSMDKNSADYQIVNEQVLAMHEIKAIASKDDVMQRIKNSGNIGINKNDSVEVIEAKIKLQKSKQIEADSKIKTIIASGGNILANLENYVNSQISNTEKRIVDGAIFSQRKEIIEAVTKNNMIEIQMQLAEMKRNNIGFASRLEKEVSSNKSFVDIVLDSRTNSAFAQPVFG